MRLYRTLAIVQSIIMILTLVLSLVVRATLKKASWDQQGSTLATRVDTLEKVIDRGNGKTSELASTVQGLTERMRQQFVTRDTMELFIDEVRRGQMKH